MKAAMYITLITVMNLAGVCYGQWQQGLISDIQITTGNIKPCFSGKADIKKAKDFNKMKTSLKTGQNTDSKYVKVAGEIESGRNGKFTIDYKVCNNGSAPIAFDSAAFAEMNKSLMDGTDNAIRIVRSSPAGNVIYPKENSHSGKEDKDSLTLQIDTSQGTGEYEFEIQIPYKQWIRNKK